MLAAVVLIFNRTLEASATNENSLLPILTAKAPNRINPGPAIASPTPFNKDWPKIAPTSLPSLSAEDLSTPRLSKTKLVTPAALFTKGLIIGSPIDPPFFSKFVFVF